jgi:hypothetical protein
MQLECICGNVMSDIGSPNETEHFLISNRSVERLQDLVDAQVVNDGIIDEWPEHWEQSGAIEIWKCYTCKRLYFYPKGSPDDVVVYKIEKTGI